jgi:hypothetical protein
MNGRPIGPRGYSLGTLFVLIAACAVLLSLTALLAQDRNRLEHLAEPLAGSAVSMLVLGAILGTVLGLFHHRRLSGAGWGALTGGLVGAFSAPILFIPAAAFPGLLATAIVGSVLVVGTAAVLRLQAGRMTEARPSDPGESPFAPPKTHPLDPDPEE